MVEVAPVLNDLFEVKFKEAPINVKFDVDGETLVTAVDLTEENGLTQREMIKVAGTPSVVYITLPNGDRYGFTHQVFKVPPKPEKAESQRTMRW